MRYVKAVRDARACAARWSPRAPTAATCSTAAGIAELFEADRRRRRRRARAPARQAGAGHVSRRRARARRRARTHAAVFEDALAGVAGGPRRGASRFVVGVDRVGQADALQAARRRRRRQRPRRAARARRDPASRLPASSRGSCARPSSTSTSWRRPSRCSRSRTGTSGCAGTSTRASRSACPGTYLAGFYELRPLPYAEAGYGYPEVGPDGRQRHQRQDHPAARRGRAVRRPLRRAAQPRARARPARRACCAAARSGCRRRAARCASPRPGWCRSRSARSRRSSTRSSRSTSRMPVVVQSELVANEPLPEIEGDPRAAAALASPLELGVLRLRTTRARSSSHSTRASGLTDGRRDGPRDRRAATAPSSSIESFADLARADGHRRRRARDSRCASSSSSPTAGRAERSVPALRDQVAAALAEARAPGWDGLLAEQRAYLDDFWERADVEIEGDAELQQAVRFALFHILQAGARAERRAIAAKGLTGPGLRRARLLGHRDLRAAGADLHRAARGRATRCAGATRRSTSPASGPRQLGLSGAAFPWRTIRGEECSGYWPAGTAAFHVNADIADAVDPLPGGHRATTRSSATSASSCSSRRRGCGARSATTTPPGRFRIDGVTGPDEYSAIADNNVYTNLMAQRNLRAAADAVERHTRRAPTSSASTTRRPPSWRDAAEAMLIPYDESCGVHPAGRGLHRARALGLRAHHARPVSAAAALPLLRPVPQAGRQAGRPRARDAPARRRVHATSRRRATSPTTRR